MWRTRGAGRASQHLQPSPEGDRTPEGGRLSGPRDRAGSAARTEKVVLSPESRVECGHPHGGDGVLQIWGSVPAPQVLAVWRGSACSVQTGLHPLAHRFALRVKGVELPRAASVAA